MAQGRTRAEIRAAIRKHEAEMTKDQLEKLFQCARYVYTKWEDKNLFPDADCKYKVEGEETCPDTGKKHWQCFVVLKDKIRWRTVLKRDQALGGKPTFFRPAKAEPWRAAHYCMKGDQSHAEWDELNIKGPTFGQNAKFTEVGERPKPPKEKGKSEAGMRDLQRNC